MREKHYRLRGSTTMQEDLFQPALCNRPLHAGRRHDLTGEFAGALFHPEGKWVWLWRSHDVIANVPLPGRIKCASGAGLRPSTLLESKCESIRCRIDLRAKVRRVLNENKR